MKTIGAHKFYPIDYPHSLEEWDAPIPTPTEYDLLVAVKAISVNPADCRMRQRIEEGSAPTVLGWDVSGVVTGVGALVDNFKPGDEVFYAGALNRPGCNSEYHLVDARLVGKKPQTLDHAHAAAMPLTSLTAWEALFERLQLPLTGAPIKRSLLIIGAAGGVGSMA
ncbi:MAG: alcohol dehydrogenase, partial [Halothiobacillaceae bacterium]